MKNLGIAAGVAFLVAIWAYFKQRAMNRKRLREALRRARPYPMLALRFHAIPQDGETVVIAGKVFTFRTDPIRPGDVLIGRTTDECYANWHEAVRPLFPGVLSLKEPK